MATVYKRTLTRAIPKGAEIIRYRAKLYAKWTHEKTGKIQRAPLNKMGDKIIVESPYYTIEYFDHTGKRRRVSSRTPDKDAAQQYANHLETEAMKRRSGLIDPVREQFAQQARRPIGEHVEDYRSYLAAKGNTQGHVRRTCRHIEWITETCHAEKIGELTGAGVLRVIGELREGQMSLRTCNAYLRSIKSFTRWLWKERRMPDDPLAGLSQFNEQTDRRHVRRELTPEEASYLVAHTESSQKDSYRLSGPTRAMAYRVALGTGFRRKELAALSPASFNPDSDPPSVSVTAAYSKRRRNDVQPIRTPNDSGEKKATFYAIETRTAGWWTSTAKGTRTLAASWPAGHRSRRAKSWPGIQRPF